LIHGLDLLKRPTAEIVTLTCQPSTRRRSRAAAGILFYAAELPAEHVTREYGTKVTTAARTVVDLARTLPFMEALVVADSALHLGKTTRQELEQVADACGRWPRIGQARHVLEFSNGLAESAFESCARATFDRLGLEPPEIQVPVRGPGFAFRVDFCWAASKTIAEADGLAKYADRDDLLDQFRRDRLLRDAGYKVVHFTWRELFETPERVVARIRAAMSAATPY
jgi:hypothetical protein